MRITTEQKKFLEMGGVMDRDVKPALKIIRVQIEHLDAGMCVATSEQLPGFFLSTIDDDRATSRIESALEHFLLEFHGRKITAEAAEDFDDELDFSTTTIAMFGARAAA